MSFLMVGYRRTSAPHDSPDACADVDECEERPERCSPGVCINSDGGFVCDCDAGYELSEDGTACIGMTQFYYISTENIKNEILN